MATQAQIDANRKNARMSTGPKSPDGKGVTKFNGLKHGLRAAQVVLPGEDRAEFQAERDAWFADWRPISHTRAVLVERAAIASWKLRRATRVEAARLYDVAADVAHEFDLSQKDLIDGALRLLPSDPREALSRLRSDSAGLGRLIGLWDDLARAVEAGAWSSRADHHDRHLNLLGHPTGAEAGAPEVGRASLILLRAHEPGTAAAPAEVAGAAEALRALCAERISELRRERSQYWDPSVYRQHLIDAAIAPTSKDAQLMHRYEMAHEKSLRASIRGLLTLEKSGADLAEAEPPSGRPGPSLRAPVGEAEAPPPGAHGPNPGHPGTPLEPEVAAGSVATPLSQKTCDKLASVGESAPSAPRPGRSAGSPGRRGRRDRPIGADPGPEMGRKRA